ncbi:MAG: hypothetical protein M1828_006980 [Chrysothrix sp. TS-e1954]|nr:MAG: hypothetical protein M1828_006980 [Chrysothrix sp. TS-e1954]
MTSTPAPAPAPKPTPTHGERDLTTLLSTLRIHMDPTLFVWMTYVGTSDAGPRLPLALSSEEGDDDGDGKVVMRLKEVRFQPTEGGGEGEPPLRTTTIVATLATAQQHGLDYEYPCRRLTLGVQSSLAAVGFMAAIGAALADEGISVNTVAGYWHDHLFIEEVKAEAAKAVVERVRDDALARQRQRQGQGQGHAAVE